MSKSVFGQQVSNLSKRLRISKAQKMTLTTVAVTSLILGAAIVLIVFLAKYIKLNANALGAKDEAIDNYSKTIANVGICVDSNNDGKINGNELSQCEPNDITLDKIPDTLQSNIMTKTATNQALYSVATRTTATAASCLDANGKPHDFLKEYQEAKNDSDKKKALESVKTCSALRVIPDALPAQKNIEAASASLDWLLKQAGVRYESLTPSDDDSEESTSATASTVDSISLSLVLEVDTTGVYHALTAMERSIRTFDIDSLTIEWGSKSNKLDTTIKTRAYYSGQLTINEYNKTVTTKGVK